MLQVFLRILAIFAVFAAGFVLRRRQTVDDRFIRQFSQVLMSIFYPALILNTLVLKFSLGELARLWILPVGAGLVMVIGWLVGGGMNLACRHWPESQLRTSRFLCTVSNYSFLPLMLVASLWGKRGEALVVFSTLGPELVLWTLGIQAITGHKLRWSMLRNLVSIPMLAILLAFVLLALKTQLPALALRLPVVHAVVRELGGTLLYSCGLAGQATIPVAATIAGMRMASMSPHHMFSGRMALLTAMRLLLIPALSLLLLQWLPLELEVRQLLLVIATMPVALTSVPMAEIYHGDSDFAAAAVLMTHIACLATIPLWLALAGIGAA